MSSQADQPIRYVEMEVPLVDIDQSVEHVVEIFGGAIVQRGENRLDFSLPRRRGVPAAGHIQAAVSWKAENAAEGSVTIETGEEVMLARGQRIALLVAGVVGATLFLAWPFFPRSGEVAWIGGLIALAVFFMTLRKTQHGTVATMLQRIVDMQFDRLQTEEDEG
jgi:hypothetical protein